MKGKKNTKPHSIDRRSFVGHTAKLIALGTLLLPVVQACNNNKSSGPTTTLPGTGKKPASKTTKKARKKWSHEGLVINSKTNVLHLPTSKVYHYYDEIKPNHIKEISRAAWNPQSENAARLNKQQSGNIMEILTLQELGKEISDGTLIIAIDTLSIAFGKEYEKANTTNFRLHELMLQLVALNSMIPSDQKWQTFTAKVVKPVQLRKRQKWMETETNFNERVKYITDRQNDYIARLTKRASKYSFS